MWMAPCLRMMKSESYSLQHVPVQRSAARDIPGRTFLQHVGQMLRCEAIARPDRSNGICGKPLARAHVAHDVQRTPKDHIALLAFGPVIVDSTEALPGHIATLAQRRQFTRLKREA